MGMICNLEEIQEEIKIEESGRADMIHPIEQHKIL